MPDAREEVVVIIQPPRDHTAHAGELEFAAAARSMQHDVEVRALGRITILPFGGLSIEVRPVRSKRIFSGIVENQSNSPAVVELKTTDAEEKLKSTFAPPKLELQPGESGTAQIDVRLKKSPFFGRESAHGFEAQANAEMRTASARGELVHRPPWLLWRWLVLPLLLCGLAAGGWFAYSAFASDDDPSAAQPDATLPATPGSSGTPATTAATRQATTATAVPSRTPGLQVGSTAVVTNSPEGDCLFVRPFHTRLTTDPRSQPTARICDGTRVTITGARVEDEGYYWYQVRTAAGQEGWSAEGLVSGGPRFLTAVP
jgi:hypothetical protein